METEIDVSELRNVKLIASDLDHTLLTSKKELPPNFDDYVYKLIECGIDFVIASGRPFYTLKNDFGRFGKQISYISDNGATVCYKDDIIYKSILPVENYQPMVVSALQDTDGVPVVCGLDSAYVSKKDKSHESFLRIFYSNIAFVDNLESVDAQANKFSVYFPNHDSKEFYAKIFKPKYEKDFSVTIGDDVWVDVMILGVNKGTALNCLAKHVGINSGQIMAFGDTYNDIEMLKAAKYSYIVKNAHADMAGYARFMTDSNEDFGVIKVLDKVLESHKK
jgi:Cof subfamily protein (haloacid dehalogenase superfamily)